MFSKGWMSQEPETPLQVYDNKRRQMHTTIHIKQENKQICGHKRLGLVSLNQKQT